MLTLPNSYPKPPTKQDITNEKEEFFKKLLDALDKQLVNKKYFCGAEMTVADLIYYSEISTIVSITRSGLRPDEYPNLATWFNDKMSTIPEIMELDKKLKEVITKYNIQ